VYTLVPPRVALPENLFSPPEREPLSKKGDREILTENPEAAAVIEQRKGGSTAIGGREKRSSVRDESRRTEMAHLS